MGNRLQREKEAQQQQQQQQQQKPPNLHVIENKKGEQKVSFNILVEGEKSCGKTSLILKYVYPDLPLSPQDKPQGLSCGVEQKDLNLMSRSIPLLLWERVNSWKYGGWTGVLICYDISSRESFKEVKKLYKKISGFCSSAEGASSIVFALVGCKSDRRRTVSEKEGQHEADHLGILFFETSAMTGEGIEALFTDLVLRLSRSEMIIGTTIKRAR